MGCKILLKDFFQLRLGSRIIPHDHIFSIFQPESEFDSIKHTISRIKFIRCLQKSSFSNHTGRLQNQEFDFPPFQPFQLFPQPFFRYLAIGFQIRYQFPAKCLLFHCHGISSPFSTVYHIICGIFWTGKYNRNVEWFDSP